MILKVIRKLLGIGVHVGVDDVAQLVELDPVGHGLPAEVAGMVVVRAGLLPLPAPAEHGITDQPRVVSRHAHEAQIPWVYLLELMKGSLFMCGCRRLLLLLLLQQISIASHDRGHNGWLAD